MHTAALFLSRRNFGSPNLRRPWSCVLLPQILLLLAKSARLLVLPPELRLMPGDTPGRRLPKRKLKLPKLPQKHLHLQLARTVIQSPLLLLPGRIKRGTTGRNVRSRRRNRKLPLQLPTLFHLHLLLLLVLPSHQLSSKPNRQLLQLRRGLPALLQGNRSHARSQPSS